MLKTTKIALLVPDIESGGGVPAVALFMIDALIRLGGREIKVISLSTDARDSSSVLLRSFLSWFRGPIFRRFKWNGQQVSHVGAWWGEIEFMRYQSRRLLDEAISDCDLVQVVCGVPAWANTVLGTSKPVSVHFATLVDIERKQRDAHPKSLVDFWRKAMTKVTAYYDNRVLMRVDAIQTMNPHMQAYALKVSRSGCADIRLAPPGIDAELYRPAVSRSFSEDGYILTVSRLDDPRKNVVLLLEAYALLPDEARKKVGLIMAGSAAPPDSFWARADILGLRHRINFIKKPSLNELIKLYQGARVFCLPSDEEGFGMVVIEAMACGVPVVATRCGGPDGIISDGLDGYLVPLDDPSAMSGRLEALINNDSENLQMGRSARSKIEQTYSLDKAGKVFLDIWDRLLADRK